MRNLTLVAVALLTVLWEVPVKGNNDVSIEVAYAQYIVTLGNKGYVRVIIRVDPHPNNRNLIFRWDSDDGESGRKDRQLEGEKGPILSDTGDEMYFGRGLWLDPGHYTFEAEVERVAENNPTTSTKIIIKGGEDYN